MARVYLLRPVLAAFVAIAALLQVSGVSAQGSVWSSFFTKAVFDKHFSHHLPFYTYEGFKTAADSYSGFGKSPNLDVRKRELAAFFANVEQETRALQEIEEINKSHDYCDEKNTKYPCTANKKYYGRGPLQLTGNGNYGACGAALNLRLLTNPDQVAHNSNTAWRTALWFWMTQGPHGAILKNSFSGTIGAINGDIECSPKAGSEGHNEMLNRVKYYKSLCQTLGVDPGTDLEC